MSPVKVLAQILLYVPLMALIGYFSTSPPYHVLAPDEALVRVSFSHSAQRLQECRQRTDEELARLSPNMRVREDCPRERAPTHFQLEVDGTLMVDRVVRPAGLTRDGAATLYWRLPLAAGKHRIVARLHDRPGEGFHYVGETTVDLMPGDAMVVDFQASRGGFLFRT
jgi:hypothetical protein